MTDFEYDIYQRKLLARNGKYRVCGSKSKKCTLSSDRLTPRQIRERNGPLMIYKFNEPMKWDEFKQCPDDIQKQYIHKLVDDFGVTITALSQMFGISRGTLYRHFKDKGFEERFKVGKNMSGDNLAKWDMFNKRNNTERIEEFITDTDINNSEITNPISELDTEDCFDNKPRGMKLSAMEFVYKDDINITEIANNLRFILGNNPNGEIKITYNIV